MSGKNKIIGMAKERDALMAKLYFLEFEVERLQAQNVEATKVIQQLSETIAFNNLRKNIMNDTENNENTLATIKRVFDLKMGFLPNHPELALNTISAIIQTWHEERAGEPV